MRHTFAILVLVLAGCAAESPPLVTPGSPARHPTVGAISYPPSGPSISLPAKPSTQDPREPDRAFADSIEAGAKFTSEERGKPNLKVLYAIKPEMPVEAIRRNIQGSVTVEILFGLSGQVKKVVVVGSSHELLADAVVSAVKQWKIQPLTDGKDLVARQTFDFKLK